MMGSKIPSSPTTPQHSICCIEQVHLQPQLSTTGLEYNDKDIIIASNFSTPQSTPESAENVYDSTTHECETPALDLVGRGRAIQNSRGTTNTNVATFEPVFVPNDVIEMDHSVATGHEVENASQDINATKVPVQPLNNCTESFVDIKKDVVMKAFVEEKQEKPSFSIQMKEKEKLQTLRDEWLGTSQHIIEENIAAQLAGRLPHIIEQRRAVAAEVCSLPYDPTPLLTLAYLDNTTGFSDIAAANAQRAMILIKAAFSSTESPHKFRTQVLGAISKRLLCISSSIILDELLALKNQAYTTSCSALLNCDAFVDGMRVVKEALESFPGDHGLLQLQQTLRDGYMTRKRAFAPDTASSVLKRGVTYPRAYPWLDQSLFIRTPELVQDVNRTMPESVEVGRAFFGPNSEADAEVVVESGQDVGPLGVFAKRDIKAGELIMVEKTIMGISNIPSNSLEYCDTCHAVLCAPFVAAHNVIQPMCCKAVAFCSLECHNTATRGYHTVLCGKDFKWLFKDIHFAEHNIWRRWKVISFLRIIAIIIADNRKQPKAKQWHPLAHPLVARMTANYTLAGTLHHPHPYDWNLKEEVTMPTRILLKLGVDIFSDPNYSQEVIQTMCWRIENNANMTTTNFIPGSLAHMVSINPNYIFLNHSCNPNVAWHAPVGDASVGIQWLKGMDGEVMKPGESAVWCIAARDIRKGEECKISYIGDPLGGEQGENGRALKRRMLAKWFDNGCGCDVCEKENSMSKHGDR